MSAQEQPEWAATFEQLVGARTKALKGQVTRLKTRVEELEREKTEMVLRLEALRRVREAVEDAAEADWFYD